MQVAEAGGNKIFSTETVGTGTNVTEDSDNCPNRCYNERLRAGNIQRPRLIESKLLIT